MLIFLADFALCCLAGDTLTGQRAERLCVFPETKIVPLLASSSNGDILSLGT